MITEFNCKIARLIEGLLASGVGGKHQTYVGIVDLRLVSDYMGLLALYW